MANLIFDKAQIEATIDKIVDRTMRMDMTWDWPCGVAYYGICEAYEVTKNERYLQLVKDRVDEYIELGLPSWTVNTCSMGHCLITLYEHTGDEKYLDIAKSKVEYLEKEALRFGDHVLQHTVSVNNDFPEQAWADTLFMAGFFLLRMGVLLKDEALIDDALNQYYWHIKYLQDPRAGCTTTATIILQATTCRASSGAAPMHGRPTRCRRSACGCRSATSTPSSWMWSAA